MTEPAVASWNRWWGARRAPHVIGREIVGPLAIADLVAVRFDEAALKARRHAGIRATDDLLALRVITACRRAPLSTSELAAQLGFSASGIRRAVRVGYEIGALAAEPRHRHRTHVAWRPAADRLIAVELKRTDWRRAVDQAWSYQTWANAAWLFLGRRPSAVALESLSRTGIGVAYLGDDHDVHVVVRPTARRRASGISTTWAAEQALVHATRGGSDPVCKAVRSRSAMRRDDAVSLVG